MTSRKFYRKEITVVVLSEDPIGEPDLIEIAHGITTGDWSGEVKYGAGQVLNGKEAAAALEQQASDPGFFRLDAEGNDVE